LGEDHDDIRSAGGEVVAVFQYEASDTEEFCRERGAPFECLGDKDLDAYYAVGLGKGSLMQYLGPQMIKDTLKAATEGHLVGSPKGGDVSLNPGTFVVARDGRVMLAHYNADSADNAPSEDVIEAVREAA
jgi:peroxiredoxin